MSHQGIRFSPPRSPVPDAVNWFFGRALGPPAEAWQGPCPISLSTLEGFVGAAELFPRIWSRSSWQHLERELAASDFQSFGRQFQESVALEMRDHEACENLASLAGELKLPLVFLKGMALRLGGYVESGTRRAADIDVLVPKESAQTVHRALIRGGSSVRDLPASDQHLPLLEHPSGPLIEVHHRLRGVSLDHSGEARVEELVEAGMCALINGWGEWAYLPRRPLLGAHLLVHALGQHFHWPAAYPQAQLLADLQDLGVDQEAAGDGLGGAGKWIESSVEMEEVLAVIELVRRLAAGEAVSEVVDGSDEIAGMARHIVAGASDPEYRHALKAEGSLRIAMGRSHAQSTVSTAKKAIFLTRGQIDLIYGTPKGSLGYLGRRLWRPFDLVARAARAGLAWWRLRH